MWVFGYHDVNIHNGDADDDDDDVVHGDDKYVYGDAEEEMMIMMFMSLTLIALLMMLLLLLIKMMMVMIFIIILIIIMIVMFMKELVSSQSNLRHDGVQISFVSADLTREDEISNMCADVIKLYPQGIDILVNNAGKNISYKFI